MSTIVELTFPAGGITNVDVASSANISASKLVARRCAEYNQAVASAIVADTAILHVCRAAGTLVSLEAVIETVATGADRTVTVDLHKGNSGSAFATVMSATIGFTNGSSVRTVVAGTFSTTTFSDGDILKLVVTVAGAAGNQALGLGVTLCYDENAS